jgi:predicted HNH restriction endonuclease
MTCTVESCQAKVLAKGMCNAHYIRARRGKDLVPPVQYFNATKTCTECGKPTKSKGGYGLCATHYRMYRRLVLKTKLIDLLGGKCEMCNGVFHHSAFDFHHKENKLEDISGMFGNRAEKDIFEEVKKCTLLCANCHRIHHARKFRLSIEDDFEARRGLEQSQI